MAKNQWRQDVPSFRVQRSGNLSLPDRNARLRGDAIADPDRDRDSPMPRIAPPKTTRGPGMLGKSAPVNPSEPDDEDLLDESDREHSGYGAGVGSRDPEGANAFDQEQYEPMAARFAQQQAGRHRSSLLVSSTGNAFGDERLAFTPRRHDDHADHSRGFRVSQRRDNRDAVEGGADLPCYRGCMR